MADPAKFDHDRLGHLLEDRLLMVPKFQRNYAWEPSNVEEYLDDLEKARADGREYFMGTVVLADTTEFAPRQLIVDGQQRLATTAVLLIAIRDRLNDLGRVEDSKAIDQRFLKRYEISQGEEVTRLVLSPGDTEVYDELIKGEAVTASSRLHDAYQICRAHIEELAPDATSIKQLLGVIEQLSNQVQALLAVASGIPEAYVIFETLNDRGADLTTADLLKNYIFSQANAETFAYVESVWTEVSGAFDKPDELVKFIRFEYSSRHGKVTNRKLYRALQDSIGLGSSSVKAYMKGLRKALEVFLALRDPDHARWSKLHFDVRDSLLAYRRFGFESSVPLLLAVFREWDDNRAGKAVNLITGWTVRAMMAGKLGGSQAEETFCAAAKAVADGSAKTQPALRALVSDFVPTDAQFKQAFLAYPSFTTARAKYLLGMIERHNNSNNSSAALPDWSSKAVTIEHIIADSSRRSDFGSDEEFQDFLKVRNQLCNFALLEKGLNKKAEDKPFVEKVEFYRESGFPLTQAIGQRTSWSVDDCHAYAEALASKAVATWRR